MSTRYLFQRREGGNYYVRLQPPGGKLVERSLGTPDAKAAKIAAGKLINEAGKITGTRPNGGPAIYLTGAPLSAAREFKAFDAAHEGRIGEGPIDTERPKLVTAKSGPDDAILETYIKHHAITESREREARDMWRIFRTVVDKPLRSCTREDGRAIVAYLEDQADDDEPLKSATLRRRMVPLVAAVNLAIDEGKLTFNPFSSVVPVRDDEDERDPFDDNDMKLIRANLHLLDSNDQLLVRVLATVGVRRSEAFAIAGEKIEDGIRYCEIGKKTAASIRRVPFPKDLLPHLPAKITGQLITGRRDTASKRLREFLEKIGVINDHDGRDLAPMQSFRHRAANRLRAAAVDEPRMFAIGGWSTSGRKLIGRKYSNKHGRSFPIKMLKAAIDKIGM